MDREDVFNLLEDASEEYLERLEESGYATKNIYSEDGEVRIEYALTDTGMGYFGIEEEAVETLDGSGSEK